MQFLEQAIARDPQYAAPYASLAICYAQRALVELLPPVEAFSRAEEYARRALSLDERQTEAYIAHGLVESWFRWNWEAARRAYERALELSPGDTTAHACYGVLLDTLSDHAGSMRERRLAFELNPVDPVAGVNVAYGYLHECAYAEAVQRFRATLDVEPATSVAWYGLGMALIGLGDFNAACATFQEGIDAGDESSTAQGFLGYALALAERRPEAQAVLNRLLDVARERHVSAYHVALVYLGLGLDEEMFRWLEKAFVQRSPWMPWLGVHPTFRAYASDPRLLALLDRMSLRPGAGLTAVLGR